MSLNSLYYDPVRAFPNIYYPVNLCIEAYHKEVAIVTCLFLKYKTRSNLRVGVKFLHQASVDQGRGRATARRVILSAAKNLTSSESDLSLRSE